MKAATMAVLLAAALALAAPAAGAPLTVTVVSALPGDHAALKIFRERFQDALDRRLAAAGGEAAVVWREAHDGAIAEPGGVFEAVEDDLAAIGIVDVGGEADRLPLQTLTRHAPFTTEDCASVAAAYHAVHGSVEGMTAGFAAAGQRYLAPVASDPVNLIGTIRVIEPGELRGQPVGMPDRLEPWIEGVEGIAVHLPAALLADRIERGVIAAALLPTTEMVRLRLHPRAGHLTEPGFGAQVSHVVTVNAAWYDGLPASLREALDATAAEFVAEAARAYCAAGMAALEALRGKDVRTTQLLRSHRLEWVAVLPPLARDWAAAQDEAGRPGTAALQAFMAALRAEEASPLRDWDAPSARVVAEGEQDAATNGVPHSAKP